MVLVLVYVLNEVRAHVVVVVVIKGRAMGVARSSARVACVSMVC
jgi:hypothetical protein